MYRALQIASSITVIPQPTEPCALWAQVHALVRQQASILAFLDCFWLLGLVAFIGPVLAIFIRKFNQGGVRRHTET